MRPRLQRGRRLLGVAMVALIVAAMAAPAMAQLTTSTIKGTVTAKEGPLEAAQVVAVDKTTGFQYPTITGADGSFALAGLRPGSYEVSVSALSYKPASKTIQVLVGQSVDVRFEVSAESIMVEDVSVVGNLIQETRTSEIVTNVTTEQINLLPQNDRNFLNFANLAPGVKVSSEEFRKDVRAHGQPGSATNVFVDGVSYKNDVLEGGVVGQDASRGNPFPQNAVQEFQVLTQNFKAEYERASTSIVSAVTKTGGNEYDGNLFLFYQPKRFVGKTFFQDRDHVKKPDYKRYQGGLDIGGPIIRDKLTFFVSYERNSQDRAGRVVLGQAPPGFDPAPFLQYQGDFISPFRSDLYFAKVAWQPATNQNVDFTFNRRDETERRGFGNLNAGPQTAFERGEDLQVTVDTFAVKHRWTVSNLLNEASVQWQSSVWNPTNISDGPQINYFGFVEIGARNGEQRFEQERTSFRDDLTWFTGDHTFKFGGVVNLNTYDVAKFFGGEGTFNFRYNPGTNNDFSAPFEGFIAAGDPNLTTDNTAVGVYAQDDWRLTPKLELNLGLRWDYETDMINTDFVTPPEFVAALSGPIAANGVWTNFTPEERSNYFSTGNSRSDYKKAFQPRLGFNWDLAGDGSSVFHGGAGRYYDRVLNNYGLDEKIRLQYRTYKICFLQNAGDAALRPECTPQQTVVWDPSFFSQQGLLNLLNSGQVQGTPEIFLIPNDIKIPFNDQYSLGYRHNWGPVLTDVTLTTIRGKNGFSFIFGNRDIPTGNTIAVSPEFSNLLLATSDKRYWYDGAYLKVERPFTADATWGFTLAYTYSKARQRGNDAFSLDYITVNDYPKFPTPDDERHRVVATGIVRVPWDITLSSNLTLSSGLPFGVEDFTNGFGFYEARLKQSFIRPEKKAFIVGDWWAYRQLDLRAQKTINLPGKQALQVSIEGFNVANWKNFGCLTTFNGPGGNPNLGNPNCVIGPTQTFQAGIGYSF